MASLSWWYYISKYLEFVDTFFFVVRKKFSHISTLHVIHHGVMPMSVWWGGKKHKHCCKILKHCFLFFDSPKSNSRQEVTALSLLLLTGKSVEAILFCILKDLIYLQFCAYNYVHILLSRISRTISLSLVETLYDGHSNDTIHRYICTPVSAALQRVRLSAWFHVVDWLPRSTFLVPILRLLQKCLQRLKEDSRQRTTVRSAGRQVQLHTSKVS